MKKLVILRRLSQIFFTTIFVYILWSTTYPLKGILPADTFFKFNPLIVLFTSISERVILPGMIFASAMLILTLLLGRFFCGWICPLGAMIDLCGNIGYKKAEVSHIPRFYILALIALFSVLGIQLAWIFDPIVIAARFVSLNLIPTVTFGLDRALIFIIRQSDFYAPLYDFYRNLKSSILGVHVYYFSHSAIIFLFFLLICISTLITKRLWCRALCPLGALYSIFARFSLLRRVVEECTGCMQCKANCRMGAINDDLSYHETECILCMDCIYDCPPKGTRFSWSRPAPPRIKRKPFIHLRGGTGPNLSRREFIFLILTSFLSLGFRAKKGNAASKVIRPPAALKEEYFLDRCIRCGNCMKVCITNGLQPVMLESGLEAILTPKLVPEIGYCEYNCTLCGNVCPTGAIPRLPLEKKKNTRLGLADIDRSICIAWADSKQCLVCEEHCPVSDKAVKVIEYRAGPNRTVLRPYVDHRLCIGCGICQNKCPTRPARAIKVSPKNSERS